uniref:Cytochrome c oxidase subunit 7A2, mitochondrial n=1 Tax=Anolis carolinensis TaxID=28377 RepID=A0A803TT32_ANOCA
SEAWISETVPVFGLDWMALVDFSNSVFCLQGSIIRNAPHIAFLLQALRQISQKAISTAPRRQITNRVPEYQKLFQEDNGIPVYLKGGVMDTILYRITMSLSIFGKTYKSWN